jgi:hypothetical protein
VLVASADGQFVPGGQAAVAASDGRFPLARDLPRADWRKFLSYLLPPGPAVIRLLRLLALLLPLAAALPAGAQVRIKDIADVEGVRENQLIGYGLVVGLNNTGDKLDQGNRISE